MGRYKGSKNRGGTVRCGWCRDTGHNKRGCPELKSSAESNPNGYAARQLSERKPRQCGYCRSVYGGWWPSDEEKKILEKSFKHDRRKCPQIVKDTRVAHKENSEFRQRFLDKLNQLGLGLGAMIVRKSDRWATNYDREGNTIDYGDEPAPDKYYLVSDILWDEVANQNAARFPVKLISMNWLDFKGNNEKSNLRIANILRDTVTFEVVSQAPVVEAGMPKNWVNKKAKVITEYVKNKGK